MGVASDGRGKLRHCALVCNYSYANAVLHDARSPAEVLSAYAVSLSTNGEERSAADDGRRTGLHVAACSNVVELTYMQQLTYNYHHEHSNYQINSLRILSGK
eukprot:2487645-Amphidinium_carterae.1